MKREIMKNLIMLSVVFAATFAFSNSVSAFVCSGYDCNYDRSYRSLDRGFRSTDSSFDNTDNNYYSSNNSSSTYTRSNSSTSNSGSTSNYNSGNVSSSSKNTSDDNNLNSQSSDSSQSDESSNSKVTEGDNGNLLGASAFGSLTALSLHGSGSFMPSSIWQWILVFFLLLIAIILFRIVLGIFRSKTN